METKTYGVHDRAEWLTTLRAGAATFRVHFQGGSSTSLGTIPAEFTTSNPVFQAVIEASEPFRQGIIKITRRTPAAGQPLPSADEPDGAAQPRQPLEFDTLGDFKAWARDERGADPSGVTTKAQASEMGRALGFEVTFKAK